MTATTATTFCEGGETQSTQQPEDQEAFQLHA
jgi:hypothetical protein